MSQSQLFKQMIDFNKTAFENGFSAMTMIQEQAEKAMHTCLDQTTWLPREGRAVVDTWIKACKNGRESFKSNVDDSFKKVEAFLDSLPKSE